MIDADEIVKVAEHAYNEWNLAMVGADTNRKVNLVYKLQELCKAIKAVADSMPTVDAAPVVHGYWLEEDDGIADDYIYRCSVCKEDWVCIGGTPKENGMKFCPNCGAKMDGGIKNGSN
jgi:DNA-directed RNA polymerase subunit RPC12/RpoP